MPVIRNCILPANLHYDVEHDLWARVEADGTVTMGLTDVGQSRAGRILIVAMRRAPGATVKRGMEVPTVVIAGGERIVGVPEDAGRLRDRILAAAARLAKETR